MKFWGLGLTEDCVEIIDWMLEGGEIHEQLSQLKLVDRPVVVEIGILVCGFSRLVPCFEGSRRKTSTSTHDRNSRLQGSALVAKLVSSLASSMRDTTIGTPREIG